MPGRHEDGARHVPVLLSRTLELLEPAVGEPGAVVVDATVVVAS